MSSRVGGSLCDGLNTRPKESYQVYKQIQESEIWGSYGGQYEDDNLIALMMEILFISEMSEYLTEITRSSIPEGCHLQVK
jgi:hypothetical protein